MNMAVFVRGNAGKPRPDVRVHVYASDPLSDPLSVCAMRASRAWMGVRNILSVRTCVRFGVFRVIPFTAENFDGWERSGCEGWGYSSVLPYFKKVEDCRFTSSDPAMRGAGGPIAVADSTPNGMLAVFADHFDWGIAMFFHSE